MRAQQGPAIPINRQQHIGAHGAAEIKTAHNPAHRAFKPIRDDFKIGAQTAVHHHKINEGGINVDAVDETVHCLGRGTDQGDLAGETFPRANQARFPLGLHIMPFRQSKFFEHGIHRVAQCDCPVKIQQDPRWHGAVVIHAQKESTIHAIKI